MRDIHKQCNFIKNRARRLISKRRSRREDIGTEMDLQLIHKYNANTKISAGYSVFATRQLFVEQRGISAGCGSGVCGSGGSGAEWAYIMFDVKF